MKPLSLKFKCFGSYVEEQYIDFEDIEKKGIVLICGDTGGGKTTILDAISCALYGKASGGEEKEGGRGTFDNMRCKFADKTNDTVVEFIFLSAGKKYKFVRSISAKNTNIKEEQNCFRYENGEYVSLVANPTKTNVNAKAREIIGLSYDQFRQVVILPQGKFEKLLVSNSENKEEILVSLFNTEIWGKVVKSINDKVLEEDKAVSDGELEVNTKLEHYGCATIDDMALIIKDKSSQSEELKKKKAETEKVKNDRLTIYNKALAVEQKYKDLDNVESKVKQLDGNKEKIGLYKVSYDKANKAANIKKQYDDFYSLSATLKDNEKSIEEVNSKLKAGQENEKKNTEHINKLEEKKGAYEDSKKKVIELQNVENVYSEIAKAEENVKVAEKEYNAKKVEADKAQKEYDDVLNKYNQVLQIQEKATSQFENMRKSFLHNIPGVLAKELEKDGKVCACPVCGSYEHPKIAVSTNEDISFEMLDTAEKEKKKWDEQESKGRKKLNEANETLSAKKIALQEEVAKVQVAVSTRDNLYTRKITGINNAEELGKAIMDEKENQKKYEELYEKSLAAKQQIDKILNSLKGEYSQLAKQKEKTEAELIKARDEWNRVLLESGLGDESSFKASWLSNDKINELNRTITNYEAECKNARERLAELKKDVADIERPDINMLSTLYKTAEAEYNKLCSEESICLKDLNEISAAKIKIEKQKKSLNERRVILDDNKLFAKRLRGDNGIGIQRYILGIMLDSIVKEANELMKLVLNGRYKLVRTTEGHGGSRKKGLDLEVIEDNTSMGVNSFSGGERFLASLCLGIGLTTVVQKMGSIKLDALFVDEGFGTLDEACIDGALDVLNHVQSNNGLVAIISHHDKLISTIQNRIEAKKGKSGSTLNIV